MAGKTKSLMSARSTAPSFAFKKKVSQKKVIKFFEFKPKRKFCVGPIETIKREEATRGKFCLNRRKQESKDVRDILPIGGLLF